MKDKYICQIGPDEKVLGGISTVIRDILESPLNETYHFKFIKSVSVSKKLIIFIKSIFEYVHMCLKKEVICTHIHMSENGSCYRTICFILLSRIFLIKVIVHSHGSKFEKFYKELGEGIRKVIFDYSFQRAEKIIVLTPGWKKFWGNIVPKEKIMVLPNSVKLPLKIERKKKTEGIEVLFLGNLGERKGTYDLINAIAFARENGTQVKLYLAGDGEIDECKRQIKNLKLEAYIHICGWVEKEKKDELLRTCDVLVLPSVYESFGIVLLEAMSYEMPVICSDGGYMKEVVEDGKDGYIVPVHCPECIGEHISYLAKHKEQLYWMGKNGYEKVSKYYTYDIFIEHLDTLYKTIILKKF